MSSVGSQVKFEQEGKSNVYIEILYTGKYVYIGPMNFRKQDGRVLEVR